MRGGSDRFVEPLRTLGGVLVAQLDRAVCSATTRQIMRSLIESLDIDIKRLTEDLAPHYGLSQWQMQALVRLRDDLSRTPNDAVPRPKNVQDGTLHALVAMGLVESVIRDAIPPQRTRRQEWRLTYVGYLAADYFVRAA